MSDDHNNDGKKGWAENPTFIRIFLGVLIFSCIASAFAGFVTSWHNPHPHFPAEEFPIFFAAWGFGSFAFIVLAGQHLRKLVGRKEEYYDERE